MAKETVSAGTNFYKHVNGWWLDDKDITIPDEYPRWGSFIQLHDQSLKTQIKLLEELAKNDKLSPDEAKLAAAFGASMKRFADWEAGKGDYSAIADEMKVLDDNLAQDDWATGLASYFARCQRVGISCPLSFDKEGNLQDADNIILDLGPSGLTLPSRAYYVDDKFAEQRNLYKEHLQKVKDLLGLDAGFVDNVIEFETKLALISMKTDQSRLFDQYFTVTTLGSLASVEQFNALKSLEGKKENYKQNDAKEDDDKVVLTSEEATVDAAECEKINQFLSCITEKLGLEKVMEENYIANYGAETASEAQGRLMVFDGDYFRRVFKLLFNPANRAAIKSYMQYKIARSGSTYCTKELDEAFFDFFSRKLNGQKEQKPPTKRSVGVINSWLGELLGKIYVDRFFSEQDKTIVKAMVDDVLEIMKQSLLANDWLTEATKTKALEKLEKFVVKIGYPDKWKNYDDLTFEEGDSLFVMKKKVHALDFQREFLEKLNTKKDKAKWEMTPQTVNAYFHPMNNEIVFPAAILQPPFYTKTNADIQFPHSASKQGDEATLSAANFGAIGAVIAHEITHGYDDQGRKFDHNGNIQDWWTEEDTKLFTAKTDLMAKQADAWVFPEDGEDATDSKDTENHKMNAQLTMGENLADLGGMSLACQAMMARIQKGGCFKTDAEAKKESLQVFFKSWANVWKTKQTKAFSVQRLATDPHAPTDFRGNLVNNIPAFYEAFSVGEKDPMYLAPDKRVAMW